MPKETEMHHCHTCGQDTASCVEFHYDLGPLFSTHGISIPTQRCIRSCNCNEREWYSVGKIVINTYMFVKLLESYSESYQDELLKPYQSWWPRVMYGNLMGNNTNG